MTDEKIIKSLNCCGYKGACGQCEFYNGSSICVSNLVRHAIDLINRQKAEIEKLKAFKSSAKYFPKYCPNCGRQLNEYEVANRDKTKKNK